MDDTQLYISFNPRIPGDLERALSTLSRYIHDIKAWMSSNCLKLNDSKTEFFVARLPYNLRLLPQIELIICTAKIKIVEIVCDPARYIFAVGQRTDAANPLDTLYWLPVCQKVLFNILLYVLKSIQHTSPNYISDYFTIHVPALHLTLVF